MGELKDIRILIVDDDDIQNYLTRRLLRDKPARIVGEAHNGLEALEYIQKSLAENPSDMPTHVLLDINMPVMDGFTFLEKLDIRQLFQANTIRVAVLSSSQRSEDKEKAKIFGCVTHFIEKPLTEDKLKAFLGKL